MSEKILYSDDKAAKQVTITGWVSHSGHFYGDDEHLARYDGCTHQICDCGSEVKRGWIRCEDCRAKSSKENYLKKPFKEWDGDSYLYSRTLDKYFQDSSI